MRIILFILTTLFCAPVAAGQVLNVYNWSEYLPERVLEFFTASTGIQVNYITYESNEEMYENLNSNPGAYDLIVPSTYYVSRLAREGLLQKLDKAALGNYHHLDPRLLGLEHDPQNDHSIPYLWGTTTLFQDTTRVSTRLTSWEDLWRPEFRGKVLLLDDMRDVFHMALRVLGYSANTTNPDHIKAAYEKLLELQPNIVEYNSDSPKDAILEGRTPLGAIWNGEIYQAGQERYFVQGVYPKEGPVLWIDSMAIPKDARNVEAAHQFIDFVMRPGIAAMIAESFGYATPNKAALSELDPWARGSRLIYPGDEVIRQAEIHLDLGDAQEIYEKYWNLLREH